MVGLKLGPLTSAPLHLIADVTGVKCGSVAETPEEGLEMSA